VKEKLPQLAEYLLLGLYASRKNSDEILNFEKKSLDRIIFSFILY